MDYLIYSPNINLFVFHQCQNYPQNFGDNKQDKYNPNLLWDKCNQEIFPKLNINTPLNVKQKQSGSRVYLLKEETTKNVFLPLNGEVNYKDSLVKVTGFAQPIRIQDNYALWLKIGRAKQENEQKTAALDLSILRQINPDGCLLPNAIKSSSGQTLVITAWVTENLNDQVFLRNLADNCVQSFLALPSEQCPPCRQEGQLFGSPIFEYGLLSQKENYCNIIVWLFCQVRTEEKLEKSSQHLIDLFFYYNKNIQAYQYSQYVYSEKIKKCHEKIEHEIYKFTSLPEETGLTKKALNELEINLKTLPKMAFDYSRWLRYLEEYQLTITINTRNYIEITEKMKSQLHNETFSFLEIFSNKNCPYFQAQIQAYLNYSAHGLGLIDKAISSIRGLVAIDQVRIERQRQEAEKERFLWEQTKSRLHK